MSSWLAHTNRRQNGAWTQRYEYGIPTTDLQPMEPSQSTGTTVRFLVDRNSVSPPLVAPNDLHSVSGFPWLTVDVSAE